MLSRCTAAIPLLLALAACAGVSPRPDALSPDSLPTPTVSDAARERLTKLVDQCVRDVVLRRYSEAERGAVEALEIDPRSARARAVRGIVLLQVAKEKDPADIFLANEGEAETVLAEKLAPQDPFVAWVRALFLAESGHLSAAAAVAEAAIERTRGAPPEERAPLFGLAGTYRYELGEERAALPLLRAYVGLRPDDATASFRIGSCLLRMAMLPVGPAATQDKNAQSEAEQAARAFQRCVELAPGDEDAWLAIGAATMRAAVLAGKRALAAERERLMATALAQFRTVATRFPTNAEAMFRVGVVEEGAGRRDQAGIAYTMALERDADHLGSLLNLATLLEDERPERAKGLLRRALDVEAGDGGLDAAERQRIAEFLARQAP